MILDLRGKLTQRNWEIALKRYPYTQEKGWSEEARESGIIIDLSKVGWVEPIAVVRLVLFIESALLNGLSVEIRMPFPYNTQPEKAILAQAIQTKNNDIRKKAQYVALNISRRSNAAKVLANIRFIEALRHEHIVLSLGTLKIIELYDWSLPEQPAEKGDEQYAETLSPLEQEERVPWYFEIVYGLQWIADPRSKDGRQIIDHLSRVEVLADILTHPSKHILAADGNTLAHVFLKELVENTIDHAGREFALITAWSRPSSINLKEQEILKCERNFAAWCLDYPLIELMVGDSGTGIPHSLAGEYKKKRPHFPKELEKASTNTRILAWSLDKWSSRYSAGSKRGTRGLYRVERIVRKYSGCLTIRSESSFVGRDCGFSNPPDYIFQEDLPRSPGTVVHVRLPIIPFERTITRPSNPALHKAIIEVVDFFNLDWSDEDQAIRDICNRIYERSEGRLSTRNPICIVADIAFARIERRTLEKLLIRLVEIAHPIALVVANVKSPSTDSAAETIHSIAEQISPLDLKDASAEEAEALDVRDAVLFQYTDGTSAWLGAPRDLIQHLNNLWENEVISFTSLKEVLPDIKARNNLIKQFAEAYHIAHQAQDGGIALNFNREDIREALFNHVSQLLITKVERGQSNAIRSGLFRTPSLEIVGKYTNVRRLLEEVGLDRATAALAHKCARLQELQDAEDIQIISDWKTSRDVIDCFRDSLCEALFLPLDSIAFYQVNPGDLPVIREGSKVILFTDLILTGDSINSLISQVVRTRTVPSLIVAVFDARGEQGSGEAIKALGHSIDLIALANIDVRAKAPYPDSEPVNINPLTHEPEKEDSSPSFHYPIKQKILGQMIKREDALYFNHIVRPNGRHFSLYLDPFKLLGSLDTSDPSDISITGKRVIKEFEKFIDDWNNSEETIDRIYFPNLPRSERPSPTKLIIAKSLADKYNVPLISIDSITELSTVERKLGSEENHWWQPDGSTSYQLSLFETSKGDSSLEASQRSSITLPQIPRKAVIVDWGSITGTAIRNSIRYVATKGATNILVVVFLSQLPEEEEKFLTSIKSIEVKYLHNNEYINRECKVSVNFVTRFPIQVYEARLCPYCRQLDRLNDEKGFYPTELLIEFTQKARQTLRPRYLDGKDGVRQIHRRSQLSRKIGGADANIDNLDHNTIKIAEIRRLLEKAKSWTSARQSLYKELTDLENDVRKDIPSSIVKRGCLIKLLSAEWLWLKQEPLSLIKFKRQIARLAVDLIKDTKRSPPERLDAIVVLRTASKDTFAKHLPEIFDILIKDNGDNETKISLISQLLYCAFTYLQRDYLIPITLRPLVIALKKCSDRIHELLAQRNPDTALQVGQTVNALQQYGRFMLQSQIMASAPEAWNKLKDIFGDEYHQHHPVCEAFDTLRFGALEQEIENPRLARPVINWSSRRDSWEHKCAPFVLEAVLPLLKPVRRVFEGLDAKVMIGDINAEILALVEGRIFMDTSNLSLTLSTFAGKPTEVQQPSAWKVFTQARDRLWNLLIDPGSLREDRSREGGSALIRVLKDCPSDLLAVAGEFVEDPRFKDKLDIDVRCNLDFEPLVFCHTDVLRESITELLRNVTRHAGMGTGDAIMQGDSVSIQERVPVLMQIYFERENICLRVKNGGALSDNPVRGRGLEKCSERLSPYGAILEKEDPLPPWLFSIKLRLLKG